MPKAADIPDADMVAIIDHIQHAYGRWAFLSEVQQAMPQMPPKVVQAKARRLIERGVITGCACGCRGDFELKP